VRASPEALAHTEEPGAFGLPYEPFVLLAVDDSVDDGVACSDDCPC
jgi:hypothetical protein